MEHWPTIIVVSIAFGTVAILVLVRSLSQTSENERKLQELGTKFHDFDAFVSRYNDVHAVLFRSVKSIGETISVSNAVFDELIESGDQRLARAGIVFDSQRRQLMKLIHHYGAASLNERDALESSFTLATEFGESDSLALLVRLEHVRSEGNLPRFREHRRILERRLGIPSELPG